jgi:glycerate kinase
MKILIAPNAFKGSLTAVAATQAIADGVRRVFPHAKLVQLPIADGGDGTLDTIMATAGGEIISVPVMDPLGEGIDARFGLLPDGTAVVEMAEASGIRLISREQLNPMRTTTFGTGQLILAALDQGARRIIVGVGGSATIDGGAGMALALGVSLVDGLGDPIPFGAQGVLALDRISMSTRDTRIAQTEIIVACDVTNPLIGLEGATRVFGPQKGADAAMVETLDAALERYASIIRRDTGQEVARLPGSGAAGGLAAGLVAFLDARLESGADVVLDTLNADVHLADTALVITGEGAIDTQTVYGKAPIGIAKRAHARGIPVIALTGFIADNALAVYEHGITALMATENRPMSLDDALSNAAALLQDASERALRLFKAGLEFGTQLALKRNQAQDL